MDSIYVVTDETVKMFPGLKERFISKADIPDDLWDSLNKMAEKGCFIYFNVYNIENYQQKVFRSEFNLDIFFFSHVGAIFF
jgi:hypothetical protein